MSRFKQAVAIASKLGGKLQGFEEYWTRRGLHNDESSIMLSPGGEGFIAVAPKKFRGKTYTKVYYLGVKASKQRQGIATKLLDFVGKDILYVTEITNTAAISLCNSYGLTCIGRAVNEFNGVDLIYAKVAANRSANDGGPTSYYDFEPEWKEAGDVIEARRMNFNQGSMFKVTYCFNIGRHSATDYRRELNKLKYFADRELAILDKKENK